MGQARHTTPDGIHMAIPFLSTPAEAAALLKISIRSFWRRVASGEIEAIKLGRTTRIPGESIKAYVRAARAAVVRVELAQAQPATHGTINRIAVEYADNHGPEKVFGLMTRYGVKHLGDLKADQLEPFKAALLRLSHNRLVSQ